MVVTAGLTDILLLAPRPVPTPLSIDTLVASVVVHASVEDPPAVIVDGVALKLSTAGAGGSEVIVILIDAEPANGFESGLPLSVTAAVIVCVPNESADVEKLAPVPICPSALEVQTMVAARVASSSSVSIAAPLKLIGVATKNEAPSAGEVILTSGAELVLVFVTVEAALPLSELTQYSPGLVGNWFGPLVAANPPVASVGRSAMKVPVQKLPVSSAVPGANTETLEPTGNTEPAILASPGTVQVARLIEIVGAPGAVVTSTVIDAEPVKGLASGLPLSVTEAVIVCTRSP